MEMMERSVLGREVAVLNIKEVRHKKLLVAFLAIAYEVVLEGLALDNLGIIMGHFLMICPAFPLGIALGKSLSERVVLMAIWIVTTYILLVVIILSIGVLFWLIDYRGI